MKLPPRVTFFFNAGFEKTTNKSQTLKLLPVGIFCGPDAELGAGPPSLLPQAVALGAAGTVQVTGLGLWNQLCSRAPTPLSPRSSVSSFRWVSFPCWEWSCQQGQAAVALWEGGSLPKCSCSTLGHHLGVGGQKPGWHPASKALGALSSSTPWTAVSSCGLSPPLTCVDAVTLNKVDSDSCLPASWHGRPLSH